MPTYGYECLSCDNQFEIFQSIKDDALTTCAECGGTLRKRIYPVGISFKGSGFYVNDYAAKPSGTSTSSEPAKPEAAAGMAEAKSETKSETASEPKVDSKPEAKAESKPDAKPTAPAAA